MINSIEPQADAHCLGKNRFSSGRQEPQPVPALSRCPICSTFAKLNSLIALAIDFSPTLKQEQTKRPQSSCPSGGRALSSRRRSSLLICGWANSVSSQPVSGNGGVEDTNKQTSNRPSMISALR